MPTTKPVDRTPWFPLSLLGITLLGAALRAHHLGSAGLWLDEAESWRVASRSLWAVLTARGLNPPLFDLLLHLWIRLFGDSESALRSLPALLGTVAVPLAGLVGRRLFDRFAGLLAALLLAVMVFPLHFAQDARPYSLLLAGTLGSFYFYIRVLEEGRRRDWAGYLLATAALCYTHLFWVFTLLAQNLHRVFFGPRERKALAGWALGQLALALASGLWLARFTGNGSKAFAAVSWIPRPGPADLLAALRTDVGFLVPPFLLLLPAALVLLGLSEFGARGGAARRSRSRTALLGLWLVVPILAPFLLSQVMKPIFWPRYTIGAVPALYLLMARGVVRLPGKGIRGAVILAMLALSAVGLVNYYRFPRVSGRWSGSYFLWDVETWREDVALLIREMQPADVVLVAPEYAAPPFNYYARGALSAVPLPGTEDPRQPWEDILLTQIRVRSRTRAWLVFRRHPSLTGRRIDEFLRASYREIPLDRPAGENVNPAVALFDLTRRPASPPAGEDGPR